MAAVTTESRTPLWKRRTPHPSGRRKFLLALPLLVLTAACTHRHVVYAPPPETKVVYVTKAPPPHKVEHRPRRPVPHAIWIGGHWRWTGVKYIWVGGYWERKPRGAAWVPGHWTHKRRGWVWVPGHWR